MRDTGIAARLRKFGVPTHEVAYWTTRGADTLNPQASGNHHTACALGTAVAPSLNTVINGRPDLAGPLCNVLQGRDDVAYVVAAGRANHGGVGSWQGVSGNSHSFGLEVEFSGNPDEPFPFHRFDMAARIHAALLYGHKVPARMVWQHYEYAQPAGRKIDLLRAALDQHGGADHFRDRVQTYLDHPPWIIDGTAAPVHPEYVLTRTLSEGMVDQLGDHIILRVEELLKWNAAKRGHATENPGKVDGKFTALTGDAVQAFRTWWFDTYEAHRRIEDRYIASPTGRSVGPKMWNALNWAAVA